MMQKIVLASNNKGKIHEIRALLKGSSYEIVPQSDFLDEEADEVGLSFIENALIKARFATKHSNLPAIADDSGLEVDALNGAPGVYSARFAGVGASDAENNAHLLEMLAHLPEAKRKARFHCAMVYMRHEKDPSPLISSGIWEGSILFETRGSNGFGYDPVFFVPEMQCSSAELTPAIKNKLSHRSQALNRLLTQMFRIT